MGMLNRIYPFTARMYKSGCVKAAITLLREKIPKWGVSVKNTTFRAKISKMGDLGQKYPTHGETGIFSSQILSLREKKTKIVKTRPLR